MMKQLNLPLMQNADLKDKIVLVRFDHNVVKKGKIEDAFRIEESIATLFYIMSKGGKPILMTHVGRPLDKKTGEISTDDKSSVKPIAEYLKNKLNLDLVTPDFKTEGNKGIINFSDDLNILVSQLKKGEFDGIYLPNTRWFGGEESKGEAAELMAKQLAGTADIYINDAFGSWQPHASTATITKYLPSYAGFLMQKELSNLDMIFQPDRPFVAVVAGAKLDTKIETLYALFDKADYLMLGGIIYNAYLSAKYGFSIKGIDDDDMKHAMDLVEFTSKHPQKLLELPYIVESDTLDGKFDGKFRVHCIHDIPKGTELNYVLDVAAKSFEEKNIIDVFATAKLFFVNAVMGLTPAFSEGTIALDLLIDENKKAMKLFGGGDTLQEIKNLLPGLYLKELDDPSYYMFTGGGAVLKAIQKGDYMGLGPVAALAEQLNKK